MDPISPADRLVALLRQQLQERARAANTGRARKNKAASQHSGVKALAAIEGADERQLRRAFIQTLLADQLGSELINESQFQQIVSRVTDAIEQDADAAGLLSRLVDELRPG